MMLYLNMNARVTLGNVLLKNVSQFEISENILEISNTAKITIPKAYGALNGKKILEQFKVGDPVTIEAGYDGEFVREFTGYVREIDSDIPLVIHCDDETYPLRQTNYVKSYRDATLRQVLADIIPATITVDAPDLKLGKFQIDNASAFAVLQDLIKDYGLYSRLQNGTLRIGLAYDFGASVQDHKYIINAPVEKVYKGNVKKNELKYRRKEDYKIRFRATALNPNGTRTEAIIGSKDRDASERTLNFAGPLTVAQLTDTAKAISAKIVYDGYTGTITGFGVPRTHAGDALVIDDRDESDRGGKYLIEKVGITYDEGGFSRKNSLSYKI